MNGDGAVIVFRRGGVGKGLLGVAGSLLMAVVGVGTGGFGYGPPLMVIAVLALGASIASMLTFYEVRLDTVKRRYAIRSRSRVFSTTASESSFDEIEGVKIGLEQRVKSYTYRRRGHGIFWTDDDASLLDWDDESYGNTVTKTKRWNVWALRLALRNKQQTEPLAEHSPSQELAAYLQAERLAKALRLDLIDVTGPGVRRMPWNKLDVRMVERLRAPGGAPHRQDLLLPPESRITVEGEPGKREIRMTVPRIAKFLTTLAIYVAVVVVLAVIANTQNVPGGMVFVNGMIWLGVLLFVPMLFVYTSRETIREEPNAFVFLKGVAGINFSQQRITKTEIEEIEVRSARSGPGYEVAVRSDKKLVRTGRSVEEREVNWLREMLCGMLAGR